MKKFLFLFVSTMLVLTSCSKDDDSSPAVKELKVTIDGVQKTFNSVIVNEDTYDYGDGPVTELEVTATIDGNSSEYVYFVVEKGLTGANQIYDFSYTKNNRDFNQYSQNTALSTVIQTNSDNNLKGTFSATLTAWNNDTQEYDAVSLTNGSFEIAY